jgi:hypothetical protein
MGMNDELTELAKIGGDFMITPAQGVAAIALSMAMKYHDINTIQDGTLYQQFKLEGRNFESLSIRIVFETAAQIEAHLIFASDRIAGIIVDALEADLQ